MKAFKVILERDGETKKVPGEISTELLREERYYAAERIQDVFLKLFGESAYLNDQTVMAVFELAPAITILKGTP